MLAKYFCASFLAQKSKCRETLMQLKHKSYKLDKRLLLLKIHANAKQIFTTINLNLDCLPFFTKINRIVLDLSMSPSKTDNIRRDYIALAAVLPNTTKY